MIDKTLNMKKIEAELEESECRIMGSERNLHMIYTELKAGLQWAGGDADEKTSRREKYGLTVDALALIHRFMFAGAFENAHLRSLEGPEASIRKFAEMLETVRSVDYPARAFSKNYFKYENQFSKKLHQLDRPNNSNLTYMLCNIGAAGFFILIILVTLYFLNN